MKVYDKEIYQKQESLKNTLIIILVFLLGFFAGYVASSFANSKKDLSKNNNDINPTNIKIESVN